MLRRENARTSWSTRRSRSTSDVTVAGRSPPTSGSPPRGTDSDFVVKLIDAYPNDYPNPEPNPKNVQMGGYQQLVRGEPFRAKFRNSFEKPEALEPGQLTKITVRHARHLHTSSAAGRRS